MDEASIRRLAVTIGGIGAVAGLELNTEQIAGVVSMVGLYLGQSAVVAKAKMAGEQAAAAVVTPEDAIRAMGAGKKVE